MDFVKYFAVSSSSASKPKDDISDVFPIELVKCIDYNKCFDFRNNKDIICLNRMKFDKVFEILSNFAQYSFINKFKTATGSEFIGLLNDIMRHRLIIPESCMSNFIIYLVFRKYNYSLDSEYIKFFNYIHVEKYFEQIKAQLNVISMAEYLILYGVNINFTNKFDLAMYLLNKGERMVYNPSCFKESCLHKVLVNNNFDLAIKLINLGCNLYESEKSFKDSALFYAMYFRNRSTVDNTIIEISDKQWEVIKLILSKCKTLNYQINPVCLVNGDKPIYRVHCSSVNNGFVNVGGFEHERFISSSGNPFTYALSGYSRDKLEFILQTHPEFLRNVQSNGRVYTILTEYYMKMLDMM